MRNFWRHSVDFPTKNYIQLATPVVCRNGGKVWSLPTKPNYPWCITWLSHWRMAITVFTWHLVIVAIRKLWQTLSTTLHPPAHGPQSIVAIWTTPQAGPLKATIWWMTQKNKQSKQSHILANVKNNRDWHLQGNETTFCAANKLIGTFVQYNSTVKTFCFVPISCQWIMSANCTNTHSAVRTAYDAGRCST